MNKLPPDKVNAILDKFRRGLSSHAISKLVGVDRRTVSRLIKNQTVQDYPSADDVGRTIMAACRETGDDPVKVVTEEWLWFEYKGKQHWHDDPYKNKGRKHFPARHYAYHALVLEFPQTPKDILAHCVGVRRKETSFIGTARYQILDGDHYDRRPKTNWFDFEALERVRNALRLGKGLESLTNQFWPHVQEEPKPFDLDKLPPSLRPEPKVRSEPVPGLLKHEEEPPTSISLAVMKDLVPLAKPIIQNQLAKVDFGDPPLERSALAEAKPWIPYEERCRREGLFDDGLLTSRPRNSRRLEGPPIEEAADENH